MHYSDDDLASFTKTAPRTTHQSAMERHLAECAECRETLALFGDFEEAMGKPAVWSDVPAFLAPAPRLSALMAEKAAIDGQNAEAAGRLAPHLQSPDQFEEAEIAAAARFEDAGVVRMLTSEAAGLCERKPKFALQLATAACMVARKVDPSKLLLGAALRERANALRYMGRFKDAIAELDAARTIFQRTPHPYFDLAIVDYIRATVVIQLEERSAEALELAVSARKTFREYGDQRRELAARLVEAEALRGVRGSADAGAAYEEVISLARLTGQKQILAYGYRNAAIWHTECRRYEKAERYHAEARALYDELGIAVEVAKTQWELARILVLREKLLAGANALHGARAKLLELGLREDHALATLDWAEARLALDRPEGVASACREILLQYESEGATRNARVALAYVHEALRTGTATPRLIGQVRSYLTQLPQNPSRIFHPAA